LISIQHVTKAFKKTIAVNDLSLEIQAGQFFALLGPNGAGKTTLIEMIEGLQKPDQGKILIDQLDWQHHASKLRKMLGISLQETKLIDKYKVIEILHLFGSFYDLPKSRSCEVLDLVNLKEKQNTYTVNLSGGQRQRLALGIALLNKPPLLLLDEPTTGLDPYARRELWNILLDLKQRENTTLILTTHYMEEAEKLCDRIVIMDQGKILADGTLEKLLSEFDAGEVISAKTDRVPEASELQQIPGVVKTQLDSANGQVTLEVREIARSLPVFLDLLKQEQIHLESLQSRKKTLDDLFIAMTGRRLNE
jgi:ABC-2 type transport system ATP-binding protein